MVEYKLRFLESNRQNSKLDAGAGAASWLSAPFLAPLSAPLLAPPWKKEMRIRVFFAESGKMQVGSGYKIPHFLNQHLLETEM